MRSCRWVFSFLFSIVSLAVHSCYGDKPNDEPDVSEAQCLIVVVGAQGTDEYGIQLNEWAARLRKAAESGDVKFEAVGTEADNSELESDASEYDRLRRLISEYGSIQTSEPLWLVFLGHGSFDTRTARFNLRGPDLSAADLVEMTKAVNRPLAVVCSFSCSSPFVNAMSADNRVVVTATKDGNQVQWNRFGDAFSNALISDDADIDRDGQTSLLEAWLFASRRTADFYSGEGRLATEHSLLDDNADGRGSRGELYEGVRPVANLKEPTKLDGALARKWHLVRSPEERLLTPEQRELRNQLESEFEDLKARKSTMPEDEYRDALESVLLRLGAIYQAADGPDATDGDTPSTEVDAESDPRSTNSADIEQD